MWTRSLALGALVCSAALGCGNRTDVGASPAGTAGDDGAPWDATATDAGSTADATASDTGTTSGATGDGKEACSADAGVRTFDAACPTISASDYDQSCSKDSDCVEIGTGNACDEGCGFSCGGEAINRCDLARYQAEVDAAGFVDKPACNCPADPGVCCRAGRCVDDYCCHDACPDAGRYILPPWAQPARNDTQATGPNPTVHVDR